LSKRIGVPIGSAVTYLIVDTYTQ